MACMDKKQVSPLRRCLRSSWMMTAPQERTEHKASSSRDVAREEVAHDLSELSSSCTNYSDSAKPLIAKPAHTTQKADCKSCIPSSSSSSSSSPSGLTKSITTTGNSVLLSTSFDSGHKYAAAAAKTTTVAPAFNNILAGKRYKNDLLKSEATLPTAGGAVSCCMAIGGRLQTKMIAPSTVSRLPQRMICSGVRVKDTEKSCPCTTNISNVSLKTGCDDYTSHSPSLLVSAQCLENEWSMDCTVPPRAIPTCIPFCVSEQGTHASDCNKHHLLSLEHRLYTALPAPSAPRCQSMLQKYHVSSPLKQQAGTCKSLKCTPLNASSSVTRTDSSHKSGLKNFTHSPSSVQTTCRQDTATTAWNSAISPYVDVKTWTMHEDVQSSRELLRTLCNKWCYTAQEDQNLYTKGGYLSVAPGVTVYSRYILVKKLGWGEFSTVWLAFDTRRYAQMRLITQQQQQQQQQQRILHQQKNQLGHFLHAFVAIKIARCGSSDVVNAQYEISLLTYLNCVLGLKSRVTQLLHNFDIIGDYGRHPCMVMPVHGANLLCIVDYMKAHQRQRTRNEVRLIKQIILTVLQGLAELAEANVLHTDIKPENILCTSPDDATMRTMIDFCRTRADRNANLEQGSFSHNCDNEVSPHCVVDYYPTFTSSVTPHSVKSNTIMDRQGGTLDMLDAYPSLPLAHSFCPSGGDDPIVCIADVGLSILLVPPSSLSIASTDPKISAHLLRERSGIVVRSPGVLTNTNGIRLQTREYRAPEVLLGLDFTPATDVWSVGCMTYELITGHFLMDPKRVARNDEQIDLEHLTMMIQLLGPLPPKIIQRAVALHPHRSANNSYLHAKAVQPNRHVPVHLHKYVDSLGQCIAHKTFYNANERRHLHRELKPYLATEQEAREAANFILKCLHSYDPCDRFSSADMTLHSWMRGDR